MNRFSITALALSLLFAQSAGAVTQLSAEAQRKLASEQILDFSLAAPDLQTMTDQTAAGYFQGMVNAVGAGEGMDQKNHEEFKLLKKNLESRGYVALEKSVTGNVWHTAQELTLERKRIFDQKLPAMNGEPAHTSKFTQAFQEKEAKPRPNSILPVASLRGLLFLRCEAKKKCTISAITFSEAAIEWIYWSSSRGANSSAGGAGDKE